MGSSYIRRGSPSMSASVRMAPVPWLKTSEGHTVGKEGAPTWEMEDYPTPSGKDATRFLANRPKIDGSNRESRWPAGRSSVRKPCHPVRRGGRSRRTALATRDEAHDLRSSHKPRWKYLAPQTSSCRRRRDPSQDSVAQS